MNLDSGSAGMTTMRIDAFLADAAEAVQGKIYALGIGWNTIYAGSFPVQHPRLALGMTISVPYTQTNQNHNLTVHLESPDGERIPIGEDRTADGSRPVTEIGSSFNVGRPPLLPAGDEQLVSLAITINGLGFERPEIYSWVISIDGEPMKRLPMRVQQLSQPGPILH
ncbi:MAG: hypothetical protein U0990_10475 [Candidatus Nanopelagicales bacterium]|nr:hypothetical protein [Candidatus Nanopelagicales bacterium]